MFFFEFPSGASARERGRIHGEAFRREIHELAQIRINLIRERHPSVSSHKIKNEARLQFEQTSEWNEYLGEELMGISEAAKIDLEEIVVLNNYTDFRDLPLEEQGCTTVGIVEPEKVWMGQTWDMHQSAKSFVRLFKFPAEKNIPAQWVFSLTGCLGMAGINSLGRAVGVNNINTIGAVSSLIWPAMVRGALSAPVEANWKSAIIDSKPSSGHGYMLGETHQIQIYEISPRQLELVSYSNLKHPGWVLHTNHCMGTIHRELESRGFLSSTTYDRYRLAEKKLESLKSFEDFIALFKSHEGYPKSVCSHFQSNSQDPSATCGGFVVDFLGSKAQFWKGCEKEDNIYEKMEINIKQ